MKANSLWAGEHYALIQNRGRGQTWSVTVQRVRMIRTYKEKLYGNTNLTTFAEVEVLNWDGTETAEKKIIRVTAYDIVEFWSDWYGDHKESIDRITEENNRRAEEQRQAVEKRATLIANLEAKGFKQGSYTIGYNCDSVTLYGEPMKRWLGLLPKERLEL